MHIQGKGVSKGIAIAPLKKFTRTELTSEKRHISDVQDELARFESARALAAVQLGQLAADLSEKIGEENSLLFEIHQMMLEDMDYKESIQDIITHERVCAEYAIGETARQFAKTFAEMDDEYMQARAADVLDVSRRVLEILSGKQHISQLTGQPAILISDDFAPSETAQFDRSVVKGLITTAGSSNSHTAIFARTMGIPAIIGVKKQLETVDDDTQIIMDGKSGDIYVDPDEETMKDFQGRQQKLADRKAELEKYRGVLTATKSNRRVKLFANIGNVADADLANEYDAEGVGLFRSEFLYLERDDYPSEEDQFKAYRSVAEKMGDKQVIIRTLDIGADKQASYFNLPVEENPALGMRAIRICLTRPELFKTQVKAILRAALHGNIAIMLPMIASVCEVIEAKEIIAEAKSELESAGIDFEKKVPVGIMVETPSAAIISDLLAREVDFFSIGTNDLIQYTLACDRMNDSVARFCDPHHESVLRLIEMVAKNAHANDIWVGICGELGADLELTERFVAMGIDELSVNPSSILEVRALINNIN